MARAHVSKCQVRPEPNGFCASDLRHWVSTRCKAPVGSWLAGQTRGALEMGDAVGLLTVGQQGVEQVQGGRGRGGDLAAASQGVNSDPAQVQRCLLYTSDAADE